MSTMLRRIAGGLLGLLPVLAVAQPQPTQLLPSSKLLHEIQKAQQPGTVLYVAAHPDDENTALIAYLAQVRGFRTGYLSLTRGGGGQNLIGSELGDALGAIRTQELLAARATDGGQQFFTRARDFGYSKTSAETYRIWNRDSVLADVVWVIRTFRPDVIVTRFSPNEKLFNTHGHHTASAQLAVAAAQAAGDPTMFPEQLAFPEARVWAPKRVLWNSFQGFGFTPPDSLRMFPLSIGEYIPLLGQDPGEISAESRSMHKSQGFGVQRQRGPRTELFTPLWGDTAGVTDPFAGMPTWKDIPGAEAYLNALQKAEAAFNPTDPTQCVEALVRAYEAIGTIEDGQWRARADKQIRTLIRQAAGIWQEAYTTAATYTPGDSIAVGMEFLPRESIGFFMPGVSSWHVIDETGKRLASQFALLEQGQFDTLRFRLPASTPYSTPFWLRQQGSKGLNTLPGQSWVGRPAPVPSLRVVVSYGFPTPGIEGSEYGFQTPDDDGITLTDTLPVVYKFRSPTDGDVYQPVEILPPICSNPEVDALIFGNTEPKLLSFKLTGIREKAEGSFTLELPSSWRYEWVVPPTVPGRFQETTCVARIFPGTQTGRVRLVFTNTNGQAYSYALQRIRYDHIPLQTLLKPAEVRLIRVELRCSAKRIGYVPGVGDRVAESLLAAGVNVEILSDEILTNGDLSAYDAILVGIRAYNAQPRIAAWHPRLIAYAEAGGTLVLQYNTTSRFLAGNPRLWPTELTLSRLRVTDEAAPVTWDDHPVLQTPNRITPSDFEGWVQERGLYFLSEWPASYAAPLAMHDPGEEPLRGSLVIGHVGKGALIYTGLSFFRELPAGVPGAYRLLANLLSYKPTHETK